MVTAITALAGPVGPLLCRFVAEYPGWAKTLSSGRSGGPLGGPRHQPLDDEGLPKYLIDAIAEEVASLILGPEAAEAAWV